MIRGVHGQDQFIGGRNINPAAQGSQCRGERGPKDSNDSPASRRLPGWAVSESRVTSVTVCGAEMKSLETNVAPSAKVCYQTEITEEPVESTINPASPLTSPRHA